MQRMDENLESDYLYSAAHGDKQAFGTLYTHYFEEIYRFVYFKVNDELTAEDITEDTFIRIWERLPHIYKSQGKIQNLRALLYRVANNLVIDHYRKNHTAEGFEKNNPGKSTSMEEMIIEQENSKRLAHNIRKLKPDYQQIVLLRLVNDLSHKEAASIMNISESHSRVLLFRALKRLKTMMSKKENVDEKIT